MDTDRINRELFGSLRLLWTRELWLWGGTVAVLAGFAVWVGATGAALRFGADFAGVELSVTDWSSATTIALGIVTVLWLLAPALVVTYLVDTYVTNVSGNVQTYYRVQHPATLVAPFLLLFVLVGVAAVAIGEVPAALSTVLVVVSLLLLVRTVSYSYRVFSLSRPRLVELFLFVSLSVVAVTILTGIGNLAGRMELVEAAGRGAGDAVGSETVATAVTGTTSVGPVTVSTMLGLATAVPAGLALLYLFLQSFAGLVTRVREPDVPRSKLRTGQRYPAFVRPTAEKTTRSSGNSTRSPTSTDGTGESTDSEAASTATASADDGPDDDVDDTADETDDEPEDETSHTKVFTAPDDGEFDGDVPGVDEIPDTGGDTSASGGVGGETVAPDASESDGGGYRCPTCAETFEPDTDFAYCPTCGTELEPE